MILYEATKDVFIDQTDDCIIEQEIDKKFYEKMGYHTSQAERNAWRNSMQYMMNILNTKAIPDKAGISIEFKIPNTSKRVDFIISGKDESGKNTAIIIELKQWQKATIVSGKDAIVSTYVGKGLREVSHPSYQAWSYATTIEDYNETVQEKSIDLHPCAYLHNYHETDPKQILSSVYDYYLQKSPAFTATDNKKLRNFIAKYIKYGDNKETLYLIDNGKIKPSKSLQNALVSMLDGNQEFVMIDDQKVVYEEALQRAKKSYKDSKKRVLIVDGGPGTGKSVIAINLLVNLTKENLVTQYVSKNSAPRYVYAAKLSGRLKKSRISNLFKGSGQFYETSCNEFDALIVDEAHRLNKKSGLFQNKGENQIKEIIHSAKFAIFFIDERQRIHIKDNGSVDEIINCAKAEGADYQVMNLESQFRCNGSDGYIAWLDDVLEIKETANKEGFDLDYDIRVVDSPNELRELIFNRNLVNNRSRLLAGYCWDWNKSSRNNSLAYDINIPEFNFSMSWNLENSSTWAIDPDSVNEVGCIHTSQGLEFDYVGVIIGDDMIYENKIVTDFRKRAKTDQSLKGIKKMYKDDPERALQLADKIIKNTYRTLMTRGQKGCYIYCTDKKLSAYLKYRIGLLNK